MIRKATQADTLALAELAIKMWPNHTRSELQSGFSDLICKDNAVCFIKCVDNKKIGFAQCQLRNDYVEGTDTSPVGYLEGIFVEKEYRHSGYAKELLSECEKWAKEKHCAEFASDCEIDNDISLEFHLSMGFEEANRIICFRKDIDAPTKNASMKTNLIIVEGLPGSGKSTTAAMIADELKKKGKKVVCVDEGVSEHPADYADYDFPDFETERMKILEKWRSFISESDKDTIYVFNCIFLQNPMCETMMRFGMEAAASQKYISEIAEIIQPLHPIIIYINQPDVKGAIDRTLDERGNDWLNAVIDYHVSQGYGKQNNLSGYEGYIKCLEERKIREQSILRSLDIDYYTIGQDMKVTGLAGLFASVGWD